MDLFAHSRKNTNTLMEKLQILQVHCKGVTVFMTNARIGHMILESDAMIMPQEELK